jgi:Golgi nucleoside diphosphatase
MSLTNTAAWAGAIDYAFEPVAAELKKGDDVVVAVRLMHKPTGKPVTDAVIVRTRVDMAPDGMADMVSPVAQMPGNEPGVYAFKTDLPMAGRYLLSVAAKVQGEPETVVGKVILKAVK